MATTHVANTVKVVLEWNGPDGATAANVFHVLLAGGGDPTNSTLLAAMAQAFYTGITGTSSMASACICNNWSTGSISAYDNSGASSNFGNSSNNILGAVSTTSLPPNVAFVTSWKALESYRGGHPRTYWPGIPASALATAGGRLVTGTFYNSANVGAGKLQTTINGTSIGGLTGHQLGCIRTTSHTGATVPRFLAFQTYSHNFRVDSQRRRLGS